MPESQWLITTALEALLHKERVNHTQLAERMGMSRSAIVRVLGRKSRPGPEWQAAFLEAFPNAKHCNMFRLAPVRRPAGNGARSPTR
jgi:hypothetical protein